MFKWLRCHHESGTLIKKGKWIPKYYDTVGLEDIDERKLIFKCDDCGKRINKIQVMSRGKIINFEHIK